MNKADNGSQYREGDAMAITSPDRVVRRSSSSSGALSAVRSRVRSAALDVGQVFAGRFRITRVIGEGGMGVVVSAIDIFDGSPVALKTLPLDSADVLAARFRREARLLGELRHPNIVGLVASGEADGFLYLAMELVDGERLDAMIEREGALQPARAIAIALQVADALVAAHDRNVVHRDVKPENLMIVHTPQGREHVKLLDFGVAKIRREAVDVEATVVTQEGSIVGSLRYISPEQVQNRHITPRTDIYLLGCLLYEMLAGRPVFDDPIPSECAIAHFTKAPPPLESVGAPLPPGLTDFVMRCLAKAPRERPANARVAVAALGALAAVVGETGSG